MPYGSGVSLLSATQQFDVEYALDTGSGFGAWRNAAYYRTGGGGTSGTTNVTMTNTTGVQAGDYINGVGIAAGAQVVSITNPTTIVVSIANAATVSGVLQFWYMPNESAFPSTGIKLKVRMTANTANASVFFQLELPLKSTNTTRQRLYSQLNSRTLTLSGLQTGSDISIRTAGVVGTALVNVDANAGTTYGYVYDYLPSQSVDIAIYKAGYKVAEIKNYLLTDANVTYPIVQAAALAYA